MKKRLTETRYQANKGEIDNETRRYTAYRKLNQRRNTE